MSVGHRVRWAIRKCVIHDKFQAWRKILNIGCRREKPTYALAQQGAYVTAVDYTKPEIDIAKRMYADALGEQLQYVCKGVIMLMRPMFGYHILDENHQIQVYDGKWTCLRKALATDE